MIAMNRHGSRAIFVVLAGLAFGAGSPSLFAGQVYLAIGDSIEFGLDPSTPSSMVPSYADQGFVRPFADFLGRFNGGVRPTVANLAIAGELSTSFFDANPPADWPNRWWQGNLHYSDGTTPQNALMLSTIGAAHAAGNSIGYVTFEFGANDVLHLTGTAAFQNASDAAKAAMIAQTLGVIQSNYLKLLPELTRYAPEARVLLPLYYNPFPSSPEHDFFGAIIHALDQYVTADAAAFGAIAVDLEPPFLGHELQLTNIASGDVHPNQAGYAAIAAVLASSVPEPSSLVLGLIALALVAVGSRCVNKGDANKDRDAVFATRV
jgi:lysophospholipase L1-like esterase